MNHVRWLVLGLLAVLPLRGAAPVLAASLAGRFEVASMDAAVAHRVAAAAEEGWRVLTAPLGLPPAFPSPVFVRVVPAGTPGAPPTHDVAVEAGGLVTLWLGPRAQEGRALRVALVDALLHRLGVAWHGATVQPVVASWLVLGAAGWWETRVDGARLDALREASRRHPPPELVRLLDGTRGVSGTEGEAAGAIWLFTFLLAESGRGGEWPRLLARLLAGGDPQAMVAQAYPGRFGGPDERELWWQTGWHYHLRQRVLPGLEAEEARELLATLARFVFADEAGADRLPPLAEVLARRSEPLVAAELARRGVDLGRSIAGMHPFYRNAALTLAEAFALGAGPEADRRREALLAQWERDWADGRALEAATTEALDRWEARRRGPAR
ncbi:MAG: hypothetical protein FJ397_03535 [Verrucomicrobia bacterium]|nr:hypothetical protein [Verrucomicrobiota bacterium]